MKIILSPAKQMNGDKALLNYLDLPQHLEKTSKVLDYLRGMTLDQLQEIWKCNDKIAQENYWRIKNMSLLDGLSPAILSYDGIAYKYMAPSVFENKQLEYIEEHLRILSAFYGVLKPMDGVSPYRLEMQAKVKPNLYDFWGKDIYDGVIDQSRTIINLASKEYSKCVEKYLTKEDKYITIVFCELSKGKLVTKGTYAKMARGEMVRFMAENAIESPEELKYFNRLGYVFREDLSKEDKYVFERK